jgi:hypothetical protein
MVVAEYNRTGGHGMAKRMNMWSGQTLQQFARLCQEVMQQLLSITKATHRQPLSFF